VALQTFDDGSTIETDSAGNVLRVTDASGAVVSPDTSIFGDFARQLLGGASGAVREYLRGRTAAPAPVAAPVARVPAWVIPAALGLGALLLFKSKSGD
jgi:hypothetical protein